MLAAVELFTHLTPRNIHTLLVLSLASEVASLGKNLNLISQTENSGKASYVDKN